MRVPATSEDFETASIMDVTPDGRGVADSPGKKVFIDGAILGETVTFVRRKRRKNYDEGQLIDVLTASLDRTTPRCDYFGACGGCRLQHLTAEKQVQIKQHDMFQALKRIGNVEPETVLPPLIGEPWGYRRRARLGAKSVDKKGRVLVGFRERYKPFITDMLGCDTLDPRLGRLIADLSTLLGTLTLKRQVPQIEASAGDDTVTLVLRVLGTPTPEDVVRLIRFQQDQGVGIYLQTAGPGSISALDDKHPPPALYYDVPEFDYRVHFGPLDFVQVNQEINLGMLGQAARLMAPDSKDRVLDLFCGVGNFSLMFGRLAGEVTGVEGQQHMVDRAEKNAADNDIRSAQFIAADLDAADAGSAWLNRDYDLVLLDPPRTGALPIVGQLARTGARRILYVSCHSGSFARDAGVLVHESGYALKAAGVMDMFPQTRHVESMALFERP